MPPERGTRVGHYDVVSLIGAGGMGEVYLAHDTRLDRKVALKFLALTLAADADRMRRFIQEAKTASALNHPNILTVFEVGESDGQPFLVTELVEGRTLRQLIAGGELSRETALDIAIQTAGALAAAHAAGIVHRDVKPENVMVRPDGVVKVLDFGLAKLVEPPTSRPPAAATTALTSTVPGLVFGTPRYMSPEQVRGTGVDTRSDVFSFAIVIYEMLTGRSPFTGDTPSDVMAAILKSDPAPLAREGTEIPPLLQRSLDKALRKDREERYQTMKDLLIDLKEVQQETQVEARLARANVQRQGVVASEGERQAHETERDRSMTGLRASIWVQRRMVTTVAALVLVAVASVSYFTRADALTDQDSILIADFANTTGDSVFDGTLKQGLAVQLSQSPFLSIFPEARVQETLRLMQRPGEPITPEIGREICQRQGLKAFVSGSIAKFDRNYSITLEAIASQTGDSLGRSQVEVEGKDQVLGALSQAATKLRQQLGESLSTIQQFDAPLELTTSSLEALNAYSLGSEHSNRGRYLESIPFFKRAVELDPNFAYAWGTLAVTHYNIDQPGLAAEFAEKAFALKDRVTELEKLRLTSFATAFIIGDYDETERVLELYKRTYPRDYRPSGSLSGLYDATGRYDRVLTEATESMRLNSTTAVPYANIGSALLALGRIAEAKDTAERAFARNLDSPALRSLVYMAAFLSDDQLGMQQQVELARGRPDEYVALEWQSQAAATGGQRQRAEGFGHRAIELAVQTGAKELAARYAADGALRDAALGSCGGVKSKTVQSLATDRSREPLWRSSLALALCREFVSASSIVDELKTRYPKDTMVNTLWLPTIRAALELERGNADGVTQVLATIRFEDAGEFWPQHIRGQAFLRQRAWREAAAEFQKVLDNRGRSPLSPLYALAHLGVARALAFGEDMSGAHKAYEEFFATWKDADDDIPILQTAKTEYARLGS